MDNPYEIYLKEKLEYDSLVIQYNHHVQMLDEIFEIRLIYNRVVDKRLIYVEI